MVSVGSASWGATPAAHPRFARPIGAPNVAGNYLCGCKYRPQYPPTPCGAARGGFLRSRSAPLSRPSSRPWRRLVHPLNPPLSPPSGACAAGGLFPPNGRCVAPFSVRLRVPRPALGARAPFGVSLVPSPPCSAVARPYRHGRRARLRALGRMRPLSCRRSGYPPPFRRYFCPAARSPWLVLARSLSLC